MKYTGNNILYDVNDFSEEHLKNLCRRIEELPNMPKNQYDTIRYKRTGRPALALALQLTGDIADGSPFKWNKIVRELTGFDAIVDSTGESAIHEKEPWQAMFLKPTTLKTVELIDNI